MDGWIVSDSCGGLSDIRLGRGKVQALSYPPTCKADSKGEG